MTKIASHLNAATLRKERNRFLRIEHCCNTLLDAKQDLVVVIPTPPIFLYDYSSKYKFEPKYLLQGVTP